MDRLLQTGAQLITYFNDYELSAIDGKLTAGEFQQFLIAQLIVFDTINARFLWKRIPKGILEGSSSAVLKELHEIVKGLNDKLYAESFLKV